MTSFFQTVQTGVAMCDRTHWGRIQVTGADRIRFLHNQTTNDFQRLQPGQGCETVFVTSTARTLDLVTAYVDPDTILLLTSPGLAEQLIGWMDRYIFFADQVTLTDVTDQTFAISLLGAQANLILPPLGLGDWVEQTLHGHRQGIIADTTVKVAVGSGLALPGYTVMGERSHFKAVWQALQAMGAAILSATDWELLRIQQGRPMPGQELTADENPLEAGLWQAVSFEKGCYIGQETIARLKTYQGVKKQLWGLKLSQPIALETPVMLAGEKVGKLTSLIETAEGTLALGYIRTKAGGQDLTVTVGEATATVVDLPFVSRGYFTESPEAESPEPESPEPESPEPESPEPESPEAD